MGDDSRHDPLSNDGPVPGPDPVVQDDPAPGPVPADRRVADLTLQELIAIMRAQFVPRGDAPAIESAEAGREAAHSERWQAGLRAVEMIGASPTDVQVCFLEGLASHPDEAKRFMDDPGGYAREAGVLLDPGLLRQISDVVLYGADLQKTLGGRLSPGALRDVARLREMPNAGVISGAAATASAAASAMFTATGKIDPDELLRIKGLDGKGVRLPGGRILATPRDVATLVTVANNAVAVYATTAVASSATVTATDTGRLSALRGGLERLPDPQEPKD
ncbi:hypothetical protein [Tropicibacter oceani]|uniref:Uncharacterized protein n=1 Tax=Tropicibacter oceani TaxID=3058420 RepID=A0ABY8QN38_9RHOB|nr:hypothetical protein [Tropicibacter oceani]WGW05994.1 hypothetical protein QF118_19505 [Tropicibacter oceani]